jgi:hypothetical protein
MFRTVVTAIIVVVTLAFGGTAYAMTAILDSVAGAAGAPIRVLKGGDELDIVGDCLGVARASRDVRVVLSLADTSEGPDVHNVLATEQELRKDSLHVRVPEMPGFENRIVRVRVFAMDGEIARACEAGQIKIA